MNAPKKIWTDPLFWHSVGGTYTDHGVEIQKTPYIRADIVDELVEALKMGTYEPYCVCEKCEEVRAVIAKLEESHD